MSDTGIENAQVIYAWNYIEWGGAQIYLLSLMKEAVKHFRVKVVIPSESNEQLLKILEREKIPYEFVKYRLDSTSAKGLIGKLRMHYKKLRSEYFFYKSLRRHASKKTVFHVDFGPWQSFWFLYLLSRLSAVFVTVHNPVESNSRLRRFLWKIKFKLLSYRKNFYLLASNEKSREWLKNYTDKPVLITYSGIDVQEINSVKEDGLFLKRYGIEDGKFKVCCAGQFIDRKGRWEFLEAAQKVIAERKDVVFVWLSSGVPSEEDLKRIAKYELGENFVLISKIASREEYLKLLRLMDLFVLPSHKEGLPIVVLEAMALEKAVIASCVDAIPEAVKHMETGFLVRPRDVSELAEAIVKLKENDSLRRELAFRGHSYALEKFDATEIAKLAVKAYKEAISGV